MVILFFVLGLVLLIVGAELLVRGASRLAAALGVAPLVIGLTVVAFGTSAPELAVSVKAALGGQASIAVGNVVGSNIFNVLFILGLAALITPLAVARQLIRLDVPFMVVLSFLLLFLGWDQTLSRLDGMLLVAILVGYIGFLIYQSKREKKPLVDDYAEEFTREDGGTAGIAKNLVLLTAGMGLLVLGSRWLVDSAVSMAEAMGVSELIIGLTIIAFGTSLPEVVTSVMASIKGERDIAVGNVVGSNIFNILSVLGITSVVAPAGVAIQQEALQFDIPIMIAVAVACLPIFFTGGMIKRWEGGLLLAYYFAYTAYLILAASQSPTASTLSIAMLYFALPLTAITLLVLSVQHFLRLRNEQ
ncbi:MAG: calcium/sodium antiporter [Candidatus Hydrogenedens sp.]|nr:calcium/sodium antiporter [Candidatus Hydrogenedens sp.]